MPKFQAMAKIEAGAIKHDITPPVGYALVGYSDRIQGSIGVHDPLYAKALVLRAGRETVGIISCDILSPPQKSVDEARRLIEKETGVPGSAVMIHGTHTHTGPDNDAMGEEWKIVLGRKIAGAFLEAWRNLQPAKIGLGTGESFIGVNRRNPSSPVKPYYLYSWPEGPFEPLVKILRVDRTDGKTVCTIINYGCHGVTLGPNELLISRDFSGYTVDLIEKVRTGSICMFLNAPCGNINPRWIWEIPQSEGTFPRFNWAGSIPRWSDLKSEDRFREAERLGNILGGESIKVLEQIIDFHDEVEISSRIKKVNLPVIKTLPTWFKKRFAMASCDVVAEIGAELQAFRIGDTVILGLPGEIFLELGMEIRKRSPFEHTLIAELCNQDWIGYILTTQAYGEGGYEPTASIFKPDAGKILVEESIKLLDEVHNGH
ncbi:MAG: neutral/alkaline non-lysosomal ceramidase N-terminal domain-containing protein [Thermoproteota archaeon]